MPRCHLLSHSEFVKAACPGTPLKSGPSPFQCRQPLPPPKKEKNSSGFSYFSWSLWDLSNRD